MNAVTPIASDPIGRAMTALPTGYYWIQLEGNTVTWEIAELRDGLFWACGCETPMRPGNVAGIGAKLEGYRPHPNPPLERGDYWVKRRRESGWMLGSWIGGQWWFAGYERGEPAREVAVVGPRLEKPAEGAA